MRCRLLAIAALLAVTTSADASESGRVETFLNVGGDVLAGGLPVDDALVIAFGLSAQYDERASTNAEGRFALDPLPIGVYRVIAVKRGFAPALAMVVPRKLDHRITMRLRRETNLTSTEREDAWEIRRALPRDILREVEAILDAPEETAAIASRAALGGDVMSKQGFDSFASEKTADYTALALRGGVGDWRVDLNGRKQTVGVAAVNSTMRTSAEAANVMLELRAPRGGAYRIASSSASWPLADVDRSETALEDHSIAWLGRETRISLRYFERRNVFENENGPSDGLELEGDRSIYRSERSGIGVHLRVAEETSDVVPQSPGSSVYAEVLTVGDFAPAPSISLGYGLLTRAGRYGGVEYVPQAAASIGSIRIARVTFSGSRKLATTEGAVAVAPVITELGRIPAGEARYRYGISLSRELGRSGSVTASATVAEADNAAYVFFDDRFEEFWDGLYVERGDQTRSVALAASAVIAQMTVELDAGAGSIDGSIAEASDDASGPRDYLVAAVRASHDGAGTTVDVAYRQIAQPLVDNERVNREIERLSVVLGQSLRLPVDLRLMVGMVLTREREAGGVIAAEHDAKRLVGGLALSF